MEREALKEPNTVIYMVLQRTLVCVASRFPGSIFHFLQNYFFLHYIVWSKLFGVEIEIEIEIKTLTILFIVYYVCVNGILE